MRKWDFLVIIDMQMQLNTLEEQQFSNPLKLHYKLSRSANRAQMNQI